MQFNDNHELYNEIVPNGYRIRGYFINEVIAIERMMDRYISRYFTNDPDKQTELISLILATKRIGFEGKRQVFKFIVNNHYRDRFTNPDLIYTQLKNIEDFRNILAHTILDTTQEAVEDIKNGTIRFVSFENETVVISYKKQELEEFRAILINLQKQLYNVLK